jgi:hypothetical protein
MKRIRRAVLVGLLVAVAAPCGATPVINVNGTYQLAVVETTASCAYTGQAVLNQSGATFSGTVTLTLVSGTGCPASIAGNASGSLAANTINFGVGFSVLGNANFTGTVSNDGNVASGTWTQVSGPAGGTWTATRAREATPALSPWSLAGLALLLAWFGVRRRVPRPLRS